MCSSAGDKAIVEFEVTHKSVFSIVVCTTKSPIEALNWVRMYHPAGTESNWMSPSEDNPNEKTVVTCDDHPQTHTHYLFEC